VSSNTTTSTKADEKTRLLRLKLEKHGLLDYTMRCCVQDEQEQVACVAYDFGADCIVLGALSPRQVAPDP